jgi:hypothetical protein
MKIFIPLIFICLFISIRSEAQLGVVNDPEGNSYLRGTLNLLLNKDIKDEKKSLSDKIHQAKLIQETLNIIATMRDVKNVVGTVSATIGDLKNISKQFYEDFKGIEAVSKDEISRIKEIVDFRDALEGRGYQSIFGAHQWYMDETARFRDRRGNMNIASAILNETDPERAMEVYQSFTYTFLNMRREQRKCTDMEILEDLAWARYYERQARLLTLIYNMAAFENNMNNIISYAGKQFPNIQLSTKSGKPLRLTPEGLILLRQDIEDTLEKAAKKKGEAFYKFNLFIRQQETPIKLALMLQVAKKVWGDDKRLKRLYRGTGEDVPSAYTESESSWQDGQVYTYPTMN